MSDNQVTGGYSSSFWMNKLINLAAVLASVWIILWLADEESDPDRSLAKIILYIIGALVASVLVWNALKFIFNWDHDETVHKTSAASGAAVAAATGAKKKTSDKKNESDDLTEIEGVGPKISELLQDAGYTSFSDVAEASIKDLKEVLTDAGERFKVHDPSSWPEQAALASEGEWAKLHALQETLDGGKR